MRSASSCLRPAPGQRLGLHQVRRDHGREREERSTSDLDGVVLEQLRAGARDHHRIDDERYPVLGEEVGDGLDQLAGEEHPGLGGVDADVGEDGLELGLDEARGQLLDGRRRRACSARSARRSRSSRSSPRPRTPSGPPGSLRRPRSRSRQSSNIVELPIHSLRRHDPDQVQRVCSQPRRRGTPVAPRLPSATCRSTWRIWDDLLQGEELAYLGSEAAREAIAAPLPDDLPPALRERLEARGIDCALLAPGRGVGDGAARRARRRHDRHRQREEPRVQPPRPRRARRGAQAPRALPLPDEGARAGPGAGARRAQGQARPRGDLRRRHRERAPLADPQVVEPDPDQPGHAPRRRPAAPRPLGRRALEPPLRRRRRGARLPRRLRLARRQRAPAPAQAGARLRRRSAVPARLRDDREPRRARRSR